MKTILFAGDSYAVADPEHKHHGEIIAEHFGLKCKLEGIPFSDVQANGYVTIGRIIEDPSITHCLYYVTRATHLHLHDNNIDENLLPPLPEDIKNGNQKIKYTEEWFKSHYQAEYDNIPGMEAIFAKPTAEQEFDDWFLKWLPNTSKENARQGNLVWVSMLGADDKAKPRGYQKERIYKFDKYDSWGNYTAGPNDLEEVFKLPIYSHVMRFFGTLALIQKVCDEKNIKLKFVHHMPELTSLNTLAKNLKMFDTWDMSKEVFGSHEALLKIRQEQNLNMIKSHYTKELHEKIAETFIKTQGDWISEC